MKRKQFEDYFRSGIANNINAADKPNEPIFISLDPVRFGNRLTGEAIRLIVVKYCKLAGIEKQMSPHRVRGTAGIPVFWDTL